MSRFILKIERDRNNCTTLYSKCQRTIFLSIDIFMKIRYIHKDNGASAIDNHLVDMLRNITNVPLEGRIAAIQ